MAGISRFLGGKHSLLLSWLDFIFYFTAATAAPQPLLVHCLASTGFTLQDGKSHLIPEGIQRLHEESSPRVEYNSPTIVADS